MTCIWLPKTPWLCHFWDPKPTTPCVCGLPKTPWLCHLLDPKPINPWVYHPYWVNSSNYGVLATCTSHTPQNQGFLAIVCIWDPKTPWLCHFWDPKPITPCVWTPNQKPVMVLFLKPIQMTVETQCLLQCTPKTPVMGLFWHHKPRNPGFAPPFGAIPATVGFWQHEPQTPTKPGFPCHDMHWTPKTPWLCHFWDPKPSPHVCVDPQNPWLCHLLDPKPINPWVYYPYRANSSNYGVLATCTPHTPQNQGFLAMACIEPPKPQGCATFWDPKSITPCVWTPKTPWLCHFGTPSP